MWTLINVAFANSGVPEWEAPVRAMSALVIGFAGLSVVAAIAWRSSEIAWDHYDGIGRKMIGIAIAIGGVVGATVLGSRFIGSAIAATLGPLPAALWWEAGMDMLALAGATTVLGYVPAWLWRWCRG